MPEERQQEGTDEQTRQEVQRIRDKQARGETLTLHEAGVLGGAQRTGEARE